MSAAELYDLGNQKRREGLWHEAINLYAQATQLDPDSPAAEARQMLLDILNYYNKDMYNP
ncbi:MAG: tetratricopeptide repeat protein [Prevotella sp.]|nr:tetratricopeptide repeat protein [Prevotella sp.]